MGDFAHVSNDLPACAFSLHARVCEEVVAKQGAASRM